MANPTIAVSTAPTPGPAMQHTSRLPVAQQLDSQSQAQRPLNAPAVLISQRQNRLKPPTASWNRSSTSPGSSSPVRATPTTAVVGHYRHNVHVPRRSNYATARKHGTGTIGISTTGLAPPPPKVCVISATPVDCSESDEYYARSHDSEGASAQHPRASPPTQLTRATPLVNARHDSGRPRNRPNPQSRPDRRDLYSAPDPQDRIRRARYNQQETNSQDGSDQGSASSPVSTSGSSNECSSNECSSLWSSTDGEFDYDYFANTSDDDSSIVPIKVSNSLKQVMARLNVKSKDGDLPTLIIPSPTAWPSIHKLRASANSPQAPSLADAHASSIPPLSATALQKLAPSIILKVPGTNSAPSLDGNHTDDPASVSPSPSTPESKASAWDMPYELTPQAMDTLQNISGWGHVPTEHSPTSELEQMQEMQERGLAIDIASAIPPDVPCTLSRQSSQSELVSAISIPSPGGFFASLAAGSRVLWELDPPEDPPSSTTAENFYNVPWQSTPLRRPSLEQIVEVHDDSSTDGPSTARQQLFGASMLYGGGRAGESPPLDYFSIKRNRQYEYDEEYDRKLQQAATSSMSRTSLWLSAQNRYMAALSLPTGELDVPRAPPQHTPKTSEESPSLALSASPPNKVVRFATTPNVLRAADHNDPLLFYAFQHLILQRKPLDAFHLRHFRADAIQAQRQYLPRVHRVQILARYRIVAPKRQPKDFGHLPAGPSDPSVQKAREMLAQSERERQALQQITFAFWELEASKFLSGGQLLPRPARDLINSIDKSGRAPRILDFGGLATAHWGWAVSLEYRRAKVYTAVPPTPTSPTHVGERARSHSDPPEAGVDENGDELLTDEEAWKAHKGPSNHRTVNLANVFQLPFPSNSIDVISARSLPTLLRTWKPPGQLEPPPADEPPEEIYPFAQDFGMSPVAFASQANARFAGLDDNDGSVVDPADEFTACIAELRRVLAPGGLLCFSLMDAEMSVSPLKTRFEDTELPGSGGGTGPGTNDGAAVHNRGTSIDSIARRIEEVEEDDDGLYTNPRRPPAPPKAEPSHSSQDTVAVPLAGGIPAAAVPPASYKLGPAAAALQAKTVEFAVALRQRGYDPCAGAHFGSKLTEAGFNFGDIKKEWVELPLGGPPVDKSTAERVISGAGPRRSGSRSRNHSRVRSRSNSGGMVNKSSNESLGSNTSSNNGSSAPASALSTARTSIDAPTSAAAKGAKTASYVAGGANMVPHLTPDKNRLTKPRPPPKDKDKDGDTASKRLTFRKLPLLRTDLSNSNAVNVAAGAGTGTGAGAGTDANNTTTSNGTSLQTVPHPGIRSGRNAQAREEAAATPRSAGGTARSSLAWTTSPYAKTGAASASASARPSMDGTGTKRTSKFTPPGPAPTTLPPPPPVPAPAPGSRMSFNQAQARAQGSALPTPKQSATSTPSHTARPSLTPAAPPSAAAVGAAAGATAAAQPSSDTLSDITGTLGALAWERWMLRLHAEQGRDGPAQERALREWGATVEGARREASLGCAITVATGTGGGLPRHSTGAASVTSTASDGIGVAITSPEATDLPPFTTPRVSRPSSKPSVAAGGIAGRDSAAMRRSEAFAGHVRVDNDNASTAPSCNGIGWRLCVGWARK